MSSALVIVVFFKRNVQGLLCVSERNFNVGKCKVHHDGERYVAGINCISTRGTGTSHDGGAYIIF